MGFNTVIGSGGSDKVNTAVLNQIHVDGVFVKTTPMGTAPNVVYRIGDGTVHAEGWDNVLGNEYLDFYISFASDADFAGISLVGTNILDVIKVANDIVSVVTVAGDIVSVITTAGDTIAINAVYNDLVKGIGTNQPTDSAILNALTNANQTIADAASTAADRVATTQDALDTAADVVSTNADVVSSGANATNAQLYEWEAEAERLTADSYATEAEDTFVNLVTSDGDGTFTYTPTTDYSALHWAAKSMAGDIAPIIHVATAKTTPVDADEFAITDSAATFGLKKLTWANLKTTVAQSGYTGFKNFIINGNFAVNQYANIDTAITAVHTTYQIDRFRSQSSIVTATIQRLTAQTVNGIVTNTLKLVATSTATSYLGSSQYVENFHKGEALTFGVWVRSNKAGAKFFIYDGISYTISNSHTGDGTWQFLTATKTISLSATILQTFVGIISETITAVPITTGDYIESTMWQLESGTVATPFEQRPIGLELSLCQRYYQTIGGEHLYENFLFGHVSSTTTADGILQFLVKMRVVPTFTYSNVSHFLVNDTNTQVATTAAVQQYAGSSQVGLRFTSSGLTLGKACKVFANNTLLARLNFSAEL